MTTRALLTADITTQKKIKQISASSRSLSVSAPSSSTHTDTKAHRHSHIQIVQNFIIIWLDTNLYEGSNNDCQNSVTQLRSIVNTVKTFTDTDQCIDFLTDTRDENVFLILSASLAQRTVPFIHEIAQLNSVYILSKNKSEDDCWTHQWAKVKGVFSETSLICKKLKQVTQQLDQNNISISFAPTSGAISNQKLDKLDQSFMHTQMLKDILLEINFDESHIRQFVDYCRLQFTDNDYQISRIEQFERKYREHSAIWWYTSEFFLHSMLNRALRLMDVDIIVKLGFYVSDLHRHIAQLHLAQLSDNHWSQPFRVYRGQGMSQTSFAQLKKNTGRLMSFNNFLSTSSDSDVSIIFADSIPSHPDLISVLFEITGDPSKTSTPFAIVNDVSHYKTEDEILFSMHAVFRIGNIEQMVTGSRPWKVQITLTDDTDQELIALREHMQKQTAEWSDWHKLVVLFINLGQFTKAQNLLQILPDQTTSDEQNALRFYLLGRIKSGQGQYSKALSYYEKDLKIIQKSSPANYSHLINTYSQIGGVYSDMGEYSRALSHYEKALGISQEILPANHLDFATSYSNMGEVYSDMGEYFKALSYYEKALVIRQEALPTNHPDLASTYSNIGQVYSNMGEYFRALSYYEKDLKITQESLPGHHPDLATSYSKIGQVYSDMGEYLKALSYYEKALGIRDETLPTNHPYLAITYSNIGVVYSNMNEYSKALSYYEKALGIYQEALPGNHPHLAITYSNIGVVYSNMNEYSKALSYYEKALEIYQEALPGNHPELATSYSNVGQVYFDLNEYSKALLYYEKALGISEETIPENHPDLAISYNTIGQLYSILGDQSKAASFHERGIRIGQR